MRRSKFVFLIMAVLYLLIALFIKQDFLIVNGNALFALALSAMLISIGDSIEKISLYLQLKNDLNAALTVTHEFLNKKINKGIIPSTVVNVRNLDEYIKRMISSGYIFCHPYDYSNSMRTMKFSICSMVFLWWEFQPL